MAVSLPKKNIGAVPCLAKSRPGREGRQITGYQGNLNVGRKPKDLMSFKSGTECGKRLNKY